MSFLGKDWEPGASHSLSGYCKADELGVLAPGQSRSKSGAVPEIPAFLHTSISNEDDFYVEVETRGLRTRSNKEFRDTAGSLEKPGHVAMS